jgi:hypothetical protein
MYPASGPSPDGCKLVLNLEGAVMATGVFVGLSTIDVVYSVDEFPTPNSKTVASDQDVFVGGPATNASVTFAHLGGRARLVSVVGRHLLASVIRETPTIFYPTHRAEPRVRRDAGYIFRLGF